MSRASSHRNTLYNSSERLNRSEEGYGVLPRMVSLRGRRLRRLSGGATCFTRSWSECGAQRAKLYAGNNTVRAVRQEQINWKTVDGSDLSAVSNDWPVSREPRAKEGLCAVSSDCGALLRAFLYFLSGSDESQWG